MTALKQHPWAFILVGGLLCLGLMTPFLQTAQDDEQLQDSPYLRIDPAKIVLSERDTRVPCGECHQLEYQVWTETQHAEGFDELHRSEQAQGILDRMGFRLAKRESLCLRCHYTAVIKNDEPRAIAGVSCESCHGAARDWVNVHNDYGGADHDTEPATHRAQRIERSIEGGMLRPSGNLYGVAANCFECHTVPNEQLINVGGHPSGSSFDLVAWSDSIRHNVLQAQWSNDETNRERTPERLRMMFVIGAMLDYEYSIRGAAAASENGIYAKAMERRVVRAGRGLQRILRVASIPQLEAILRIGSELDLSPSNTDALMAAADHISEQARQFNDAHDGSTLAALDPLIQDEPAPTPDTTGPSDETPAADDAPSPDDATTDAETADAATETPTEEPTPAEAAPAEDAGGVAPQGEQRRRPAWFAAAQHATLGPDGCSCHARDGIYGWWDGDAHSRSALPLLNESPRAVQIATTYGLSRSQMKRGNQICMNCHGTIITEFQNEEVFDGVSCENCHGAGTDFARKHQQNGYDEGAPHGMRRLDQAGVRAQNCSRCHHITDVRLLSSGHPTGEGFNLGQRNERITHWQGGSPDAGTLNSAYASAIGSRALPSFQLATAAQQPAAPTTSPSTPTAPNANTPTSTESTQRRTTGGAPVAAPPPPPRPPRVPPRSRSSSFQPLDLPPLPAVSDSTSTEDLLLIIKERLERLYDAVSRNN